MTESILVTLGIAAAILLYVWWDTRRAEKRWLRRKPEDEE